MELYASYRDSFRNCSTFVYVGTEKEVEDEWNKRDRRKKELEQKGFHGYALTPMREENFGAFEFGKAFSGFGFMTSMDKFTYNYYITLH